MTFDQFTEFLGWCTLLNIGLLLVSMLALFATGGRVQKLHARLFDIEAATLSETYFNYLALYKILILVFNLIPYLVLRLAM